MTMEGWDEPAPVVYAFDKRGEQIANITIRTPAGASEIFVYRAVRAPTGVSPSPDRRTSPVVSWR